MVHVWMLDIDTCSRSRRRRFTRSRTDEE